MADAPTTLMAYMLSDFYRPGVQLDFPRGGELISSDLPGSPLVSVGVQLDFPRGVSLNRVVVGVVVDEPGSGIHVLLTTAPHSSHRHGGHRQRSRAWTDETCGLPAEAQDACISR